MTFALICVLAIVVLGVIAAVTSRGEETPIVQGHDCSTCTNAHDGSCKIACLMEEKRKREEAEEND